MGTVTPIRPDVVIPLEPTYTCPVCRAEPPEPDSEFLIPCATCGAKMHCECYLGRVVSLEEWRTYVRWLNTSDDVAPFATPTVCLACRATKGGA
jgi:hypothetical protein